MKDPVLTTAFQTYERESIEKWFALGRRTDPMTGQRLGSTALRPNAPIRDAINEWQRRFPEIQQEGLMKTDYGLAVKMFEEQITCAAQKVSRKQAAGGGGSSEEQLNRRVAELERQLREEQLNRRVAELERQLREEQIKNRLMVCLEQQLQATQRGGGDGGGGGSYPPREWNARRGKELYDRIVANDSTLTRANFCGNGLTDNEAIMLGDALKQNQTLTALNLGENQIGDAGAVGLGEGLKQNQTLTALRLRNNHIGDAQKAKLRLVKNACLQVAGITLSRG